MPIRHLAIIEAPSNLGLRPTGVEKLADTLLSHRLAERLRARRAGRIAAPAYSHERKDKSLPLNAVAIADYATRLADATRHVLDEGEFPMILGGDCSILLGPMLALKRHGRYGLPFIDAHTDFYPPEVDPFGEAASMDLAFATGRGPAMVADIDGQRPMVRDEDIFAFGYRDNEQQVQDGSPPLPEALRAFDLAEVCRLGIDAAAARAVEHVGRDELDGFFIHFDADCLADAIMPAVDYRLPDGLSSEEAKTVLRAALRSGKAVGIEVTIYNPNLDPDGSAGRGLADLRVEAFAAGR
jgi:arginase